MFNFISKQRKDRAGRKSKNRKKVLKEVKNEIYLILNSLSELEETVNEELARIDAFGLRNQPDRSDKRVKSNRQVKQNNRKKPIRKRLAWTKEEEEFLLKNGSKLTRNELAARLNRPLTSVDTKLRACELNHNSVKTRWTEKEAEFMISELKRGESIHRIAKKTGRTEKGILSKLTRMGYNQTQIRNKF